MSPSCPICGQEIDGVTPREKDGEMVFYCQPCLCKIDEEDYYELIDQLHWFETEAGDVVVDDCDEDDDDEDGEYGLGGDWWKN